MGVTIHFEGQLKSSSDFEQLLKISVDFAQKNQMLFSIIDEESKLLQRVRDEEEWDYQGPVKGIRIQPDDATDPLWLEFDEGLYVQEFCKTQFAELETHIQVIELLKLLREYFIELTVFDEGEYWETGSKSTLIKHLGTCFQAMEKRKLELPKVSGPYEMADARIIDLMED